MQRRSFLGSMLSASLIAAEPAGTGQQRRDRASSVPKAKWLENGLIDAGGSHEPYIFVVRRGGNRLDARDEYERAQSEEVIRRLKDQGIEVFHTHLYKGFGMAAEAPDMADAKRTAEMAHRLGMKVDSYVQWNTLMYETFFAEEPRAKDWVQRDAVGRPIMLTYGYQQSFRYRPCFANQEYLDYLKKIVRFAVEEVKTDFIHFDNFDLNPEPDSCHCHVCVPRFRAYLKEKYTPAQRKERFGFENVDYVNPPEWNAGNPPAKMEIIFDPAIQEWISFRCYVMVDALRQMSTYAKSMNPEVAIEVNPHGITGANRAWEAGLDHAQILKWTDVFWTEESNVPGLVADGRLISKIRSYKLARKFHNVLLAYIAAHPLEMAECLAFNQTIGYAGNDPIPPDMLKYVEFYRRHREYYTQTEDVANVALLRSLPSITYNQRRAQLSAILAEQALIQSRIPFDLVFDEHLADLKKYRVLILPDSECLSDEQLRHIRSFVDGGGGLVAIGQAGLYDQWRRLRVSSGLTGLVDGQMPAKAYEETVEETEIEGAVSRKEVGAGRTVYIPELQFDGPLPQTEPYFTIGNHFWKAPKNMNELVQATEWAAREEIPVSISGPDYLIANAASQSARNRMVVHLVNYKAKSQQAVGAVDVHVKLPAGAKATEIRLYSPDGPDGEKLKWQAESGGVSFTVPGVQVYSFATVQW
jgi:hypothetical protein